MKYNKPHLTYNEQVSLLRQRGLIIDDPPKAVEALKRIGYYRLSGYFYPMRVIQRQKTDHSNRPQRLDTFVKGARFSDAVALHDFDHRLQQTLLDGLQQLEIGLRVKVGYILGKRDPLAHLDCAHLDCAHLDCAHLGPKSRQPHPYHKSLSRYDLWRKEYDTHQGKAQKSRQEFVLHFIEHYNSEVPVWAAVEFMPLGCLITLFDLLDRNDQRRISRDLGIKDQKVLLGWLRPLNVLRNHCAHANRVWNRPVVFQSDKLNLKMLLSPDLMVHLQTSPKAPVDHRVYFHAATTAYLLKRINPHTGWPGQFVSTMTTFPDVVRKFGLSPEQSMGFIENWREENLWI